MTWSDGIGIAQAVFLAAAAFFAWRAYALAKQEREAARLQPVITETQTLAEIIARYNTAGSGIETVFAQQARLRVALDFLPIDMLPQSRLLARLGREDLLAEGQLEAVRLEQARVMEKVSPASFRQLSGSD